MKRTPRWLDFEQRHYHRLAGFRDQLFQPILSTLTQVSLTPTMLSLAGVGLMLYFAYLLPGHVFLAVLVGFIALLLDWIDGPLARYQHTASDKGKLIDVIADNTSFIIYMIAIVQVGYIGLWVAAGVVSGVVLAKVLAIIKNQAYLPSDWHFRAAAGFIPSFVVGVLYIGIVPVVLWQANYFGPLAIMSLCLVAIDIAISVKNMLK